MIVIVGDVTIAWVPDGAGQMEVPSAQQLTIKARPNIGNTGAVTVPGTNNNPTAANITTAMATFATNIGNIMGNAANLAIIQGWASGTG